jgi:tetratricopeptide (TPR) repeat protein
MEAVKNLLCRKTVCFLIIASAVAAAYGPAINAPFVLDDPRVVERSLKIRDISNFFDFRELFSARPLVNLSFAINYEISGLDVRTYHITNLAIHVANAMLVYFLAAMVFALGLPEKKSTGENKFSVKCLAPFFAAALFALHPIQTQPVIYISQRAALMACFFYLLSVLFFMMGRSRQIAASGKLQHWLFFAGCVIFAIMAFLSKKNAASLPLAILMVEFIFFDNTLEGWKKKLPVILGLVIVISLAFAWFAGAFNGDLSGLWHRVGRLTRETADVGRWQYLCTQFTVILLYLKLIVFPAGLNIDHGYSMKGGFFEGITPIAFVLITGVIILSLVYSKRYKIISFGVLWFFIALSVESSILPIRDAMFEHRIYLAFPGICMIFAYLLNIAVSEKEFAKTGFGAVIFIACILTVFSRAQTWQSELSLWQDSAQKAPHNARAWNNYGNALVENDRKQAAAYAYQKAIDGNPFYARPYCNLGKIFAEQGKLDQAEQLFLKSIELDPKFAEAHNNLAIVYTIKKNSEKGIEHFEKALKFDRQRPMTHYNLGKALLDQNNPEKALEHFLLAVSMQPDIDPMVYYLAAVSWALIDNPEKAAIWINQAREKGLDKSENFVKKDPRFEKHRNTVLEILSRRQKAD